MKTIEVEVKGEHEMKAIEVNVFKVQLVVEGKATKLTKSMAKQFPIKQWDERRRSAAIDGRPQPAPICKVAGCTLIPDSTISWLYLVPDDEAGLIWIWPATFNRRFTESILERGGWVDNPADVPTAIL